MSYFKSLRTLEYVNVLTVVSHPVENLIAKVFIFAHLGQLSVIEF